MEVTTALKVVKTSRSAIDSLENSKEEFKALIDKMDKEVQDLFQQVRIANSADNAQLVGRMNKLELHRNQLQEMLADMKAMYQATWEEMRAAASQAYEEASMARQ